MEELGIFFINIGDAINRTPPMEIERIFLLRLLDTLIDLKSKFDDYITYDMIAFIDDLITEVSIVASKEPKKRTKNNLLFLTKSWWEAPAIRRSYKILNITIITIRFCDLNSLKNQRNLWI